LAKVLKILTVENIGPIFFGGDCEISTH